MTGTNCTRSPDFRQLVGGGGGGGRRENEGRGACNGNAVGSPSGGLAKVGRPGVHHHPAAALAWGSRYLTL